FLRRCRRAATRVTLEDPGHRELAELVAHHRLGDVDGDVLLSIVDGDRQSDHLRRDRRTARPGFDHATVAFAPRLLDLLHEVVVDERPLLQTPCHLLTLLLRLAPALDKPVRRFALAGAAFRLPPRRRRMTAA